MYADLEKKKKYQHEYSKKRWQQKKLETEARRVEITRKIAAAIVAAELSGMNPHLPK